MDVAKHLYDISILFGNNNIKKLLKNKKELNKLISYKRKEEKARIGGIDEKIQIKDFNYFRLEFNNKLIRAFENMQDKYVLNDKYRITIDEVKTILKEIHSKI